MKLLYLPLAVLLLTAVTVRGADDESNRAFFQLAGEDFTYQEARQIATLTPNIKDLPTAVRQNFAAAATLVLCRRSNITLSPERTRQALTDNLLLQSPEARRKLEAQAAAGELTWAQYLENESQKFANQLAEAVRRWYKSSYPAAAEISDEHVRAWYYRNMDLFRQIKVDPNRIWIFDIADNAKLAQALAALKQGMSGEAVRRNYALDIAPGSCLEELQKHYSRRSEQEAGYFTISGTRHLFLFRKNALSSFYLPLNEKLASAIREALADALAKARLAEELKNTFKNEDLRFY